jgi:Fe-S cluster assembly protein SufD
VNPSETVTPERVLEDLRLGEVTSESIAELSRASGEPEFLARRRAEAWAHCLKTPFPGRIEELWRRTDISGLKWDSLLAAGPTHPTLRSAEDLSPAVSAEVGPRGERSALLVQIDSSAVLAERDPELERSGVVVAPIAEAARTHPALVERLLGGTVRFDESRFTGLTAALSRGGAFVHIPARAAVARPIRLHFSRSAPDVGTFPHVLISLDAGSEATVIEEYASTGQAGGGVHVGTTEVVVGESAKLHLATFLSWGENVYHFGVERARVARDARFHWTVAALGGKLTKADLEMHLEGEGSEARFSGCYFGNQKQHFDFHTFQNHRAGHTTSDLLFKGALRDRARMVYQGLIKVHPDAQRSDAYQANRNLLLSDRARADSIPSLEIEANDVRCTHGATVGQIDEDQLFYLMTRGLTRREAEEMLLGGFFEPVLGRIPAESLRAAVTAAVERKAAG